MVLNFDFWLFAWHNGHFSKNDVIPDILTWLILGLNAFILRFLLRFVFKQQKFLENIHKCLKIKCLPIFGYSGVSRTILGYSY